MKAALAHDAVLEETNDLLLAAVRRDWHPDVVALSLRPIIDEMLETATYDDWMAIAQDLLADAREVGVGA